MRGSPRIRRPSTSVGATVEGFGGGGGGGSSASGGGGGWPIWPPISPVVSPQSPAVGSHVTSVIAGVSVVGLSSGSIRTRWTSSFTVCFFTICGGTGSGRIAPGGGGGGGEGGGPTTMRVSLFARSSCSTSQTDLTHIVTNRTAWNSAAAV